MTERDQQLQQLFEAWSKERVKSIESIPPSGSNRLYYRIFGETKTAIAAYNPDTKENRAFIHFSKHFKSKSLPVPTIYTENLDQHIYLQEDLGATALYDLLPQHQQEFSEELLGLYKKSVEQLAHIQIKGGEGLDYNLCYPRAAFDKQSMLWDMNTFKYYFVKLANVTFDEQALEDDFHSFADYLLEADCSHFMFRDFQSRNIMIRDGEPFFIDYQGGRKGAMQYDLASLLYQAKANLSHQLRNELLEYYLNVAEKLTPIDRTQFTEYYYGYVLIRSIQVLGTYGYRGLYERKEHFIKSIPFALSNVKWLLENTEIPVAIPELRRVLHALVEAPRFQKYDISKGKNSPLKVSITSFSYKKGIPKDESTNGGGFVFDCRAVHNPGRYEPYKQLTGRDESVITFLKQRSNIDAFIQHIFRIVDNSVENYIERDFQNLMINFGCTGGQHRSVYSADQMAQHIKNKYGVQVSLWHRERGWAKEYL